MSFKENMSPLTDHELFRFFQNHMTDVIQVTHGIDRDKLSELCEKEFGISVRVDYTNEMENNDSYFVLKPKLICLYPFCLVYSTRDDFFPILGPNGSYVFYIDKKVKFIENKNDLFYAAKSVYGEEFKVGLKTLSLTKELFLSGVKNLKIIQCRTNQDSDERVVHHLI